MLLILRLLVNAGALLSLPYLFSGITVNGPVGALISAVVLGFVNAFIRPIIKLLTLPLNILTLGLFSLVINAVLFWLVAGVLDGLAVTGFIAALKGALFMSVVSWITSLFLKSKN